MGAHQFKRLVLLGGPGSGKGTLGRALAERLGVPLISTGDMLRQASEAQSPLGHSVKTHVEGGTLVPDDVMEHVVDRRLSRQDCLSGFVLDGFPRTLVQAQALEGILAQQNARLEGVLLLVVDKDVALRRNLDRLSCPRCGAVYNRSSNPPVSEGICDVCGTILDARKDDSRETISSRWDVYRRLTEPLIEHFAEKGLLHRVQADRPVLEVLEDAWSRIGGNGVLHDSPQEP